MAGDTGFAQPQLSHLFFDPWQPARHSAHDVGEQTLGMQFLELPAILGEFSIVAVDILAIYSTSQPLWPSSASRKTPSVQTTVMSIHCQVCRPVDPPLHADGLYGDGGSP